MIKKILFATCLLTNSLTANAELIEYKGYSRDVNSNIVKSGELEWLMWDVTIGMSLNEALEQHNGWTLATNENMATLFNAFQFGPDNWTTKDFTEQSVSLPWDEAETGSFTQFIKLFGYTYILNDGRFSSEDPLLRSRAKYGVDDDGDGQASVAMITDDFTILGYKVDHAAHLYVNKYIFSGYDDQTGVALVRKQNSVSPIPLPTSVSLLALGLVVLGFSRRQALRR